MIKIAVIGVGSMGVNHARVIAELPDVELSGVADPDSENLDRIRLKHGSHIVCLNSYRDLLDKQKLDAVVVAAPTAFHKEIACEALSRGLHVLVEKPIAASVAEGEEMIDCAKKQNRLLCVGHIERFNPAVLEMQKRVKAGDLGQILMIHSRRQSPLPTRIVDVGVGVDLATHELDMMRIVSNSDVSKISAEIGHFTDSNVREDTIFALLRFKNGVLGILDVNWITPTTVREIGITGERGKFILNYHTQDLDFYENPSAVVERPYGDFASERAFTVTAGNMIRYQIKKREPLRNELEAFVKAITNNQEFPVSGEDGLAALRLAQEIVIGGNASRLKEEV